VPGLIKESIVKVNACVSFSFDEQFNVIGMTVIVIIITITNIRGIFFFLLFIIAFFIIYLDN